MSIFNFLATPLGWLMWLVYEYVGFHNYFLTIFIFTLLVRLLLFPLSLKNQKSTADRARLAPRLERIQKKYKNDRQKLAQKQQELYEKEGVSMTGGCLPMLVQMVVLFGIIAVIYSPLQYLVRMDTAVIDAAVVGVQQTEAAEEYKVPADKLKSGSYYREMYMMNALEANKEDVIAQIETLDGYDRAAAEQAYDQLIETRDDFMIGGYSLLENPWRGGFSDISLLWIIPLLSGVTALLSSILSMHYNKQGNTQDMQQAQGCMGGMMYGMPLFSLFIAFTVPGGVGVYWICSNVVALLQTVVLNHIYNPAKIRAQAQVEYEERRRRKAEDKKRLAAARQREAEEAAREEEAQKKAASQANQAKKSSKKPQKAEKSTEEQLQTNETEPDDPTAT